MTSPTEKQALPGTVLAWNQVRAWRVLRHQLQQRAPREELVEVAGRLGGVQAQLMSAAELALWARVENLTSDDVPGALWEERRLVKTWAMRGTLHLLPAAELWLWEGVLSLDQRYRRPAWLRYFGMTLEDMERLIAAVAQALEGQILTREDLVEEVARLLGSEDLAGKLRHSWGSMLKPSAFRGELCFAPSAGQKVRFTRPDTWLGHGEEVETGWAEREVTQRFLATYGPTTRDVYAQWLGAPAGRVRRMIQSLGDEVTAVEIEGMPAWALAGDLDSILAPPAGETVRLLPAFDQYVIAASRHAGHFLPGPFRDRIYRPQGWLSPVLLVNGRMDGVWRHERKGSRLLVQIEPFVEVPAWARHAAEEEGERLAAFLGGTLELRWIARLASTA